MKKVIKPRVETPEEAEYTCDVTGKKLEFGPAAHLTVWCGYHSHRDGLEYTMHLSQEGLDRVMKALKSTTSHKMRALANDYMGNYDEIPEYEEDKT